MKYDIHDFSLSEKGRLKIEWAESRMPELAALREGLRKEKPFAGTAAAVLQHVTPETAVFMLALRDGGGKPVLCAADPSSTQDDIAAALVRDFHIPVFARRGETRKQQLLHLEAALEAAPGRCPVLLIDYRGGFASLLYSRRQDLLSGVIGAVEETAVGLERIGKIGREGRLVYPVIAAHELRTDGRSATRTGAGQSVLGGIIRAANILIAGKTIAVSGYNSCGRGIAECAAALGARVYITGIGGAAVRQAEAEGFQGLPRREAFAAADIIIAVSEADRLITADRIQDIKDGAVICNGCCTDSDIDSGVFQDAAVQRRIYREHIEAFTFRNGKTALLLGAGRIIGLAAAEGIPPEVMDFRYTNHLLCAEYLLRRSGTLKSAVLPVPEGIHAEAENILTPA